MKKVEKKAMEVARKLKYQADYSIDSNLKKKFVWRKKILRDLWQGVEFSLKAERKRRRERKAEIEKVKKSREERAIQRARSEEEMARLGRERARAEFHDWEKKEYEFDFDQSKLRSEIRLRQGRPKPIDILLHHEPQPEPYTVFKGLSLGEIEQLHNDIKLHLRFDRARIRYWESLLVVCEWELADERGLGLHTSIEADVRSVLQGKTFSELEALQSQIESKMQSGTAKVVEVWEAILRGLPFYKAKACLKEISSNDQEEEDPQLLHADDEEDKAILERKRTSIGIADPMEEVFGSNEEIKLHDVYKYKSRKPKYFNRDRTGYQWNKYNQSHYDHDNPPPKTVQGYKFDIFYPDLVNKPKAPTCTIEKDGDNAETCIIRFHAGPPYEDIAFRIVNKEWESSHKKGFKCTFERGILQVYFNFKRYNYRR